MSETTRNVDRQVGAWFAEGAERAPAGLLAVTLARTSQTRQRPAVVAMALGAPSPAEQGGVRIEPRLVWLLLALVAAMIATTIILVGIPRPAIVVAPSPHSTRPAVAPSATPVRSPSVTDPPIFSSEQLGFAVARDPSDPWTERLDTWDGHVLSNPEWVVEFDFASCPESCGGDVSVSSSSPRYGVVVGWTTDCGNLSVFDCAAFQSRGGGAVRLRGASLDELAAAWEALFGPTERSSRSVDELDALVMRSESATGALFVHGGRTFAVTVRADDRSPDETVLERLHGFLDSMQFPDLADPLYRDDDLGLVVSSLDSGPWSLIHHGWGSAPGDANSVAFWFGECVDNLCDAPSISLSNGAPETGAIVARDEAGELLRVRGSSLAQLQSSWSDLFGPSTFGETTLDRIPALLASDGTAHMAVLGVRDGRVVTVTIHPAFLATFDPVELKERLRAFAEGAVYFAER